MITVEVDGRNVSITAPPEGIEIAAGTAVKWLTELQGVDAVREALRQSEASMRKLEGENATLRQRVRELERVIKRNEYPVQQT